MRQNAIMQMLLITEYVDYILSLPKCRNGPVMVPLLSRRLYGGSLTVFDV